MCVCASGDKCPPEIAKKWREVKAKGVWTAEL